MFVFWLHHLILYLMLQTCGYGIEYASSTWTWGFCSTVCWYVQECHWSQVTFSIPQSADSCSTQSCAVEKHETPYLHNASYFSARVWSIFESQNHGSQLLIDSIRMCQMIEQEMPRILVWTQISLLVFTYNYLECFIRKLLHIPRH